MIDALGERMKRNYEDVTRYKLPRRTFIIVRIDGKAFHSYTKAFQNAKPFSDFLAACMDDSALMLTKQMMGFQFAYGQSDEYSFVLTDFAKHETEPWFGGNIQKIASVAASIFTANFNSVVRMSKPAYFDARVFTIPEYEEVLNYFIWRQKDCMKNAIHMIAREHFSEKVLTGMSTELKKDLLISNGIDVDNSFGQEHLRGRGLYVNFEGFYYNDEHLPIFTEDRGYLKSKIPYGPELLTVGYRAPYPNAINDAIDSSDHLFMEEANDRAKKEYDNLANSIGTDCHIHGC
jgi:tRNA(His) guanylyltransferase